jgi:ATP-dependent DNA helicase RecG
MNMNKEQILKIIESGESQEIEFKESYHSSQEFSKIMCGFANTYGGVIILGVNSKKEVVGIKEDADKVQQKLSSSAQAVSPPILPNIETHEINNKKVIITII